MSGQQTPSDLQKQIADLENKVQSLQKEKEDYRTLFDSILYGIQEIDTKGTILYANAGDHRIHGYDDGELIGRSIFDFFETGAEKKELAAYFQLLVKEQPVPTPWFSKDKRKDGTVIDLRIDWNYKLDKDGKVIGFISLLSDITKDKKLQENLQESEEKFHLVMDSLEAIVYVADMDTYEILFINKFGRQLLGDVTGRICWQSIQANQTGPCEFCTNEYLIGADGNPAPPYVWDFQNTLTGQWFHIIDRAIKWVDGRTVRLEIATDISDRKDAELALKESEEKYSKLFNSEIDAIAIFDTDTREIIDCNNAFLKLYGYSREEALQLTTDDISAEPEKTAAAVKDSAATGDTRVRRRLHRKKDGTEIVVDIAAGPFMLEGRKLMFAKLQDITDHVEAENELIDLEERFRSAFHTSPDSININSMDGKYVEINEGFKELTGYTRKDIIGRSSIDINIWVDPEDRQAMVDGLQKTGHISNLEADFRMKNGSIKTALMSANIVNLAGEPHILSITRDITARKQAERDKAKLEAQLRQVYKMEAIGTMAGGIAHDFNNILTIILGNADLARYVAKADGPGRQYIDKIIEASGRAKEMVRQILAFSRQAKQDLVPIKPHMVFNESLMLLRSTIPTSIDIQQDLDPKCGLINADPTQLNQVLMNLCGNAVHAMNEKGLLQIILRQVELGEKEINHKNNMSPGPYALLQVKDTGKGMSNEVMERIFDPFFTTKKVGEGTGMGLSVVHGIIDGHGGMITTESTPNKGATFNVYFPIVDESAPLARDTNAHQYKGDEHILFVDDEESLTEIAVEMLQMHGYRVTAKTSSIDALNAFKGAPDDFDLVITDQTMPQMSGAELSKEILKLKPSMPIILSTGYSSKISKEMAREIGIAAYFFKPFDAEKLTRSVRKALDEKN